MLGPQADPAGTPPAREAASKALTALLTGMQDKEAARALLDALGNTVVHDAADAALRQYLAGLGPERAGPAIAAVYFLDDWLAVALGVTPDQLAAETRRRGLQLEPPGDIAAAAPRSPETGQPSSPLTPTSPRTGTAPPRRGSTRGWDAVRTSPNAVGADRTAVPRVRRDRRGRQQNRPGDRDLPIQTRPHRRPGSITRYRSTQTVRVVSAADGQPVAEQTFQGADPSPCLDIERFPLGQPHLDRFGDDPDLTQAVPWLESLIHPPAP